MSIFIRRSRPAEIKPRNRFAHRWLYNVSMQNLIRIYHVVQELLAFSLADHDGQTDAQQSVIHQ